VTGTELLQGLADHDAVTIGVVTLGTIDCGEVVKTIATDGFDDGNGIGGWFERVTIVEGARLAFGGKETISEAFKIVDGDEITGGVW